MAPAAAAPPTDTIVVTHSLDFLQPSPLNPRRRFDQHGLDELARSIQTQGVIVPLIVRPSPKNPRGFEIIDGERRYRAAKSLGVTTGALVTTKATRAARPTPALTGPQARILEALKAAGEPVSPGELAKAVKMDVSRLRYHTRAMAEAGLITAAGTTASRRLSLP